MDMFGVQGGTNKIHNIFIIPGLAQQLPDFLAK
jgi:hypothetical protein